MKKLIGIGLILIVTLTALSIGIVGAGSPTTILDEQEGEIATSKSSIDDRTSSLENQLAVSIQHVEDMRIIYNRNMVILFSLAGALLITGIISIVLVRKVWII